MCSARRADPFGVAALAAAGAMTAHEIGYLGETGESVVSHEYFGVLGPIVILALCAAAWFASEQPGTAHFRYNWHAEGGTPIWTH